MVGGLVGWLIISGKRWRRREAELLKMIKSFKKQLEASKSKNINHTAMKQLQQLGLNDDQIKQALQSGSINLDDGRLKKVKRMKQ